MPTTYGKHPFPSQAGYQQGSGGAYTQGAGDINFANDQMAFVRFSVEIPKGATITSAVLTLNMVAKNDTAQSCNNVIGFQQSGDPLRLIPGSTNEWPSRWAGGQSWVPSWTALRVRPSDSLRFADVDVTSLVSAVTSRSDWKPGAGLVCMIYTSDETGSDMGFRANNDFLPKPELNITYTVPAEPTTRQQINACENSEFDSALDNVETGRTDSSLPGWYQNPHFGSYVDPANYGTFARTTDVSRVSGRRVAKFTTGAADGINKYAGIYCQAPIPSSTPYVFCGWCYIPSATVEQVSFGSVYEGGQDIVTERDQWVPFCSTPVQHASANGVAYLYFTVAIAGPRPAQRVVYISEPAIVQSAHRIMPFNGQSTNKPRLTHQQTAGFQRSNRIWTPRTMVPVSGTPRARSRWTRHPRGMMILSEV